MRPIILHNVSLFFPHKICFEHVSAALAYGTRIGITGANGAGKSTLLHMLHGSMPCSEGRIDLPSGLRKAHVPQLLPPDSGDSRSGGQRFHQTIMAALATEPDLLLLDEPTNHLDEHHRAQVLRHLARFQGTLVVVTHDKSLLRLMHVVWRIHEGALTIFSGTFDDCLREERTRRHHLEVRNTALRQKHKESCAAVQQEQQRQAQSTYMGKKKFGGDKMQAGLAQNRAEKNGILRRLRDTRRHIEAQQSEIRLPEQPRLRFQYVGEREKDNVLTICDGSLTYPNNTSPSLSHLFLNLNGGERLAVRGQNGSGKTSLLRGIWGDTVLQRGGFWHTPQEQHIGYIDQHYAILGEQHRTVLDLMRQLLPHKDVKELRCWLNDFLFRKNEEVHCPVGKLSGGERTRLCLAMLAARSPRLLLLDEITNNLDAEALHHVTQVLRACPSAMLLVSHDRAFIEALEISAELVL